ncbi:hypothetical protein [Massilia sp. Root418]|jgi:hypothetical protein|uniref:hypothetical protein n=1 Tax=Massilia sp. Root418 TaxID=1736532 RepID=UPI000A4359DE|nr:hypothetical protein [Massilia sp. Root418]
MSNKQLNETLATTLNQADVPATQDVELTDADLDDVAGGGSCAAMCGTFSLA